MSIDIDTTAAPPDSENNIDIDINTVLEINSTKNNDIQNNKSWSHYRQVQPDYVSTYTMENFTRYIPPHLIKHILEVGARDLTDARHLLQFYPGAHVTSFECAPYNMEICNARLHPECGFFSPEELARIDFVPQAVVNSDQKEVEFWQVDTSIYDNIGASSLFVQKFDHRSPEDPDANRSCIQYKIQVPATRLQAYYDQHPGHAPDLVCLDIQGAELQALKSLGPYIKQVKYIILEAGFHTGYDGGCTFDQIHDHLTRRGFVHVFNSWSGHELPKQSEYTTGFYVLYTRETVSPIWGFFFDHGFEDLPLSSWTNPTHHDYELVQEALNKRIETVLTTRPRPTELRNDEQFGWFTYRMNRLQLIDAKEDPYLVVDHLNNNPAQRKKCIVTYLGYTKPGAPDRDYTRSIQMIRKSLIQLGFDGHLIYRVGGFPGLAKGRLKYADSPYSFKPFMLEEVADMGYEQLLWLDSACCPVRDIQPLFQFLEEHPVGFFAPGYQQMNSAIYQTRAYDVIMRDLHLQKPPTGNATIHTQILGLNMSNEKCRELMRRWLKAAEDRVPFLESDQPPYLLLLHEFDLDDCAYPSRYYCECPNRKIDYYKTQESALVIHSYDLLEPLIELPESLVV